MAFRNVIIDSRCKLEYSLNYLVHRKGLEEKRILMDEIKLLIICSTQVSITSSLISELSKKKVKIIFCNEKNNPECEIVSYQNNYYSYRKIKEQINFASENKEYLWKKIIEVKILNQSKVLKKYNKEVQSQMLLNYSKDVQIADTSNREGHSAKVYFNALFGLDFNRNQENNINKYLNYGYSILLSSFNREIKSLGYLTELGIHHIGESNSFNLSCDFMEPLRPIIDQLVCSGKLNDENFKYELVNILTTKVKYNSMEIFLDNAIHLYVEDLLHYLKSGKEEYIKFIEYEF